MKKGSRLEAYLQDEKVRRLYEETRSRFLKSALIGHNWGHVQRDIIHAIWIGEAEGADMSIIVPAMILHDIGFFYAGEPSTHHRIGAERCPQWLTGWERAEVEKIASCILRHKGSHHGFDEKPVTLEEKVVCDADALDKTGHLGVLQAARVFVEFSENRSDGSERLQQMAEYFSRMPPVTFYTPAAEKIAQSRGGDLRSAFCRQALQELEAYRE